MKIKIKAVASLVFLLSTGVLLTILLAWLLYPLAISFFRLEETVYLSSYSIRYNFNQLMKFLTLPWVRDLKMPNFPTSSSGLKHFFDVKNLFHLSQLVSFLTLWPAWSWLRQNWQGRSFWRWQRQLYFLALAPLVGLVSVVLVGFDTFFVFFHHVLFPGDSSWLFDPATDPVIWILPAEFFLASFLLFLLVYEGAVIGLLFATKKQAAAKNLSLVEKDR